MYKTKAPSDMNLTEFVQYVHRLPGNRWNEIADIAGELKAIRGGWQPIETAPKPERDGDGFGRRVLLLTDCGEGTRPSCRIGWWLDPEWVSDELCRPIIAMGYRVTHWMPLPPPPGQKEQTE